MRRRDLLAIGGSVLGGSAVLGASAVSRTEVKRQGEIAVGDDSSAYLGISPGVITDELTEQFRTGERDLIVKATNQVGVDLQGFVVERNGIKNAKFEDFAKTNSSIAPGESEEFKADLTCIRTNPSITYDVSVGSGGTADNDVSIDATRTRNIDCETGIAARDAAANKSDRHVIREFPGVADNAFNSAQEPDILVINYPNDFQFSSGDTVTVRIGESTDTFNNGNIDQNGSRLKIKNLRSSNLKKINDVRVLQVNYDITNGNLNQDRKVTRVKLNGVNIFGSNKTASKTIQT